MLRGDSYVPNCHGMSIEGHFHPVRGAGWRSGPGEDLYLSVRYRDGSLRLIVYDAHPAHPHPHPRLAALCDARRRGHLRVLAAVVRDCDGEWGFGLAPGARGRDPELGGAAGSG